MFIFFKIFAEACPPPYRSLLLNGFFEIWAPPLFISGYATGFIARQVNDGETWVQTLHPNVKQAQILSYVYIFHGFIVSILQPLSPGNVNSQKNHFDYSMICTFAVFCQIFFVT